MKFLCPLQVLQILCPMLVILPPKFRILNLLFRINLPSRNNLFPRNRYPGFLSPIPRFPSLRMKFPGCPMNFIQHLIHEKVL